MAVNKNTGKGDDPVVIKTKPGTFKDIGGGESEIWNQRQMGLLVSALPGVNTGDKKNAGEVGSAVVSGVMDLKPKDPIEGMLASQIVVAHEAALSMYRRAWSQPPEYFDARCRYLQIADKCKIVRRCRAIPTNAPVWWPCGSARFPRVTRRPRGSQGQRVTTFTGPFD